MNNSFNKLTEFLDRLEIAKITYTLAHHRSEAIMVFVAIPGECWEIEFSNNGTVEIERFRSHGDIGDESLFAELFAAYADEALSQATAKLSEHSFATVWDGGQS